MQQKDLVRRLVRVISDAKVDSRMIELEITESMLMRNAEQAGQMLRELKQFGIRLSVDDFGTGYSSLGYLKSFPLDTLKIDRSFVRDIASNPDDAMITGAVISMAHSLHLRVVAEGVENAAQLALLAAGGCDEMQGYYFSRPLAAEPCAALLRDHPPLQVPGQPAGSEHAVLVLDDDAGVLSLMNRVLSRDGYRVLTASSAAAAFDLLATQRVDLVISDHRMPEMTGVEFLRRVKGLYPGSVRIVMSGHVDVETVTEAINQGAVYKVLAKPLDFDQLRANIKEAFAHKALLDENRALTERLRLLRRGLDTTSRRGGELVEPDTTAQHGRRAAHGA
jgi:CheY-like chemotaxis protein